MNDSTRPPTPPKFNTIKITLSIALALTLAAFVFFGLSTRQEERKETFQLLGGVCLVGGAILLFIATLQYVFTSNKSSIEYLPSAKSSSKKAKPSNKNGGNMLIVISADSWCGFSKKMSAEVPALQSLLDPMGVEVVLVSDMKDKDQFQKLSTQHSARGFPHSVLIVDGTKIADIPGYMPAPKIQEIVSSKLS